MNIRVTLFIMLALIIVWSVGIFVASKSHMPRKNSSVLVQGIARGNYILFSNEISGSVSGAAGMGLASAMTAIVVSIYNIFGILCFRVLVGEKTSWKRNILEIIKTPLIIGIVAGFAFLVLDIQLPESLSGAIAELGRAASPVVFLALGGTLAFSGMHKYVKELAGATLMRIIIIPVICVSIAVLLGFREAELATILALFASPTGSSTQAVAEPMGGNGELAGMLVVITTVFSVLTLFVWISILAYLGVL